MFYFYSNLSTASNASLGSISSQHPSPAIEILGPQNSWLQSPQAQCVGNAQDFGKFTVEEKIQPCVGNASMQAYDVLICFQSNTCPAFPNSMCVVSLAEERNHD